MVTCGVPFCVTSRPMLAKRANLLIKFPRRVTPRQAQTTHTTAGIVSRKTR